MSNKPVTLEQVEQIRKMAKEKSVSRQQFQQGLDDGTFALALDMVRMTKDVILDPRIESPAGGRLVTVSVPVVLDRDWQQAVTGVYRVAKATQSIRAEGDHY